MRVAPLCQQYKQSTEHFIVYGVKYKKLLQISIIKRCIQTVVLLTVAQPLCFLVLAISKQNTPLCPAPSSKRMKVV